MTGLVHPTLAGKSGECLLARAYPSSVRRACGALLAECHAGSHNGADIHCSAAADLWHTDEIGSHETRSRDARGSTPFPNEGSHVQ